MSKAGTYSNQGDDYQRAIAANWIIKMMTDSTIEYVQVESNGILGINEKVTKLATFVQILTIQKAKSLN